MGSARKASLPSGGAAAAGGVAIRRKRMSGAAICSALTLTTARSSRKAGVRTSTLRSN